MNKKNSNKKILFFPIKLFICFLIFTEILLFIGPIDFEITNPILLILYFMILNGALYYGYKIGIVNYNYSAPVSKRDYSKTLNFILIFSLLFTFVRIMDSTTGQFTTPVAFFLKVIDGVISPISGYATKAETPVGAITYIIMIFSAITYMAIPLGIFNWNKLKLKYKVILGYIICIEMGTWLSSGTRKGILDVLLIIIILTIARNPKFISEASKYKKNYVMIFGFVIMFLFYFIYSNLSRYSADSLEVYGDLLSTNIKPFYIDNFSLSFYLPLYAIESYLCQGYYALDKALSLNEFCFSYGLGNSWFQINVAEKFGYNPIPDTYLYALEQQNGISHSGNWHSIYVWLANDFTFFGVPFVVYYIGKYFAKSWIETVLNRDFFAPVVFSLFSVMVFYFFANNQVLSFSFIPFVTALFFWKYKFRFK